MNDEQLTAEDIARRARVRKMFPPTHRLTKTFLNGKFKGITIVEEMTYSQKPGIYTDLTGNKYRLVSCEEISQC